jgi:hypothetical protein
MRLKALYPIYDGDMTIFQESEEVIGIHNSPDVIYPDVAPIIVTEWA